MRPKIPVEKRFWEKTKITNKCWEWVGGKDPDGYGNISLHNENRSATKAHRFSWVLHNGKIPKDFQVLHECDNPSCVNPKHLFLGTAIDNMIDRDKKQRQALGERNRHAKLNSEQVKSIRKEYSIGKTSYTKLASKYKVTFGMIGHIVSRRSWTHI